MVINYSFVSEDEYLKAESGIVKEVVILKSFLLSEIKNLELEIINLSSELLLKKNELKIIDNLKKVEVL